MAHRRRQSDVTLTSLINWILSMIIVCGGIKGGSGKTTLACHLAVRRSLDKADVLLIDADDQESATEFAALRTEALGGDSGFTSIKLTGKAVRDQIQKLAPKYDDIIIDTGGRDTVSQRAAIVVADKLMVPFAPRSLDVWTLDKVGALLDELMPFNEKLEAYAFINRADHQGIDNDAAQDYLKESDTINLLPHVLGNRKAFASSIAEGLGVSEYRPKDKKAIQELESLYSAVFAIDHASA